MQQVNSSYERICLSFSTNEEVISRRRFKPVKYTIFVKVQHKLRTVELLVQSLQDCTFIFFLS